MDSHGDRKTRDPSRLLPLLVFVLTVIPFLPALQNGFLEWDDNANFLNNPNYRGLGWPQLKWMFGTVYWGHYQPLSWVTLGLDYLIWGMDPFGYHLTSLLLHATNAVLFYFLALRLLALSISGAREDWALRAGAAFAAVLFAIHPLRVESVAWVTERRDVVSGLFFLLTVQCYIEAATAKTKRGYGSWLVAAIGTYILSLLSKAVGMSLPAVLLVLDVYPLRRLGGGQGRWFGPAVGNVWQEKLPFFLPALIAAIVAASAQIGALKSLSEHGVSARIAQALFGLAFYVWKTIVPVGLSPLYELPADFNPAGGVYVLSGLLVVIVTAVLFFFRRVWPAALAVWVYYVAMLAPVSGIFQAGPQLVALRYSYLSCLGWALLAGGGLIFIRRRWLGSNRTAFSLAGAALATVVVGLSYSTYRQTQAWRNTETLWRQVLAVTPNSAVAHNDLGNLLQKQGKLEEAIEHFHRVIEINPTYWAAHYNLGNALAGLGRTKEASDEYREAIRISSDFPKAHYNLGLSLFIQGKPDEAIVHYRKALEIDPGLASAHYSLGRALAQKGESAQAIKEYKEAVKRDGKMAVAYYDMGNAYFELGQDREAVEQYRQAVKISPGYAAAYYNMGNALSKLGEIDNAIEQYRAAIKHDARYAEAYTNLGNALEARGEMEEAVRQYRRAVEVNPRYAPGHYNLGNALLKRKELEPAIEAYRRAIGIDAKNVEARTNLASALNAAKKPEEAVEEYREVLKIDSRYAPARFNLGLLLGERGEVEEAMEQFHKVIEVVPGDADAHYQLGRLLARAGRVEEAAGEFRAALKIEPRHAPARQSLERLPEQLEKNATTP
jgi:tetratricopeptide (TPR) repeat protein